MPRFCVAYGCTNRSDKADCLQKHISFHRLPLTDSNRLKQWLIQLKRDNFEPNKHSVLCSEHFSDEDFENAAPSNKRRILKKDAVPSKFSFKKSAVKRKRTSYQFRTSSPTFSVQPPDHLPEKGCQTDMDVVAILLEENQRLKEENYYLKGRLQYYSLHVDTLSDIDLKILTGFNKSQFETIYLFLNFSDDDDKSLSMKQKLYVFLVRLKSGITEEMLALIFRNSQSTISRIILMMTNTIYNKISNISIWPNRKQIVDHMPLVFQKNFPKCRVIVDATEFEIQKPSNPKFQQLTFSNYKNRNTVKCLVGISPSGAISFISEAWGGSISDKEIFLKSGLLELLEEGDSVLADRGFVVKKELEAKGCKLFTPHFLKDKIQFNIIERKDNKKISRHRVHVERAILRIKNFNFFLKPLKFFPCIQSVN